MKREDPEDAKFKERAKSNPFLGWSSLYGWSQPCDAESRIFAIRGFNAEQCRKVIAMPDVQKTVRIVAERRLRRLTAEVN